MCVGTGHHQRIFRFDLPHHQQAGRGTRQARRIARTVAPHWQGVMSAAHAIVGATGAARLAYCHAPARVQTSGAYAVVQIVIRVVMLLLMGPCAPLGPHLAAASLGVMRQRASVAANSDDGACSELHLYAHRKGSIRPLSTGRGNRWLITDAHADGALVARPLHTHMGG